MSSFFQHWIFLIGLVLALIVGAASHYFTRPALEVFNLARASSSWTEAEAKVVFANLDSTYSGFSGSTNHHEPIVRFSYRVDGQSYEADTILFGHLRLTNRAGRVKANRILDPYRNNPTVIAYYNPENPSQAVLEPGFKLRSLDGLLNAGLGFVIALGLLWLAFWLDSPFRKLEPANEYLV